MADRWPRRKFFVDVRTQGPLLAKVALIWAGGTFLLCALLYWLADEELGRSFYSIHQNLRNTWEILLPAVVLSGAVSFLATIVATAAFVLRESHRIGGPLHKFGKLFGELAAGNLDADFRFRKGDLLRGLADSYRGALLANGERIRAVREGIEGADGALRELSSLLSGRSLSPGEREALERASRHLAEAGRKAAEFRTSGPDRQDPAA